MIFFVLLLYFRVLVVSHYRSETKENGCCIFWCFYKLLSCAVPASNKQIIIFSQIALLFFSFYAVYV